MIFRSHDQRNNGGLIRSLLGPNNRSNGVVSNPSSQECSQDVFNFQESKKGGGDRDGGLWKSKKLEVFDVDTEPCGSIKEKESNVYGEFEFVDEDEDELEVNKKVRKVSSNSSSSIDPFAYNLSEESEDFVRGGNSVVEFSRNGGLRKSKKCKNVDSDSYGLNLSKGLVSDVGGSKKLKKIDRGQYGRGNSVVEFSGNGGLRKSKKSKNVDSDSYVLNLARELVGDVGVSKKFKKVDRRQDERGNSVVEFSGNGDLRRSKKCKNVDSDSYGLNSSQDLGDDVGISKKLKKVDRRQDGIFEIVDADNFEKSKKESDPFEYNSSQESEDLVVKNGRRNSVVEFSENRDSWKLKKCKNVNSDSHGLISSQELGDVGVSKKLKKVDKRQNEGLEIIGVDSFNKPKKFRNCSPDPYAFNSSEESEDYDEKNGGRSSVVELSKNRDLWKSKKFRNIDLQEKHGLNLSQGWCGVGASKKFKKMDRRLNGDLQKEGNNDNKKRKVKESGSGDISLTAMSVETHEYDGMEDVNAVNSALDGLKNGQPERSKRESLLSLLAMCGTAQQRRGLRVQGLSKTIIDGVVGLSLDDLPSNVAAAALIYILTSDGQDDLLLCSPSCIRFLMKLLKPLKKTSAAKEISLPIGSRILGLCRSAGSSQDSAKETDPSSNAVMLKVKEVLVECKEIKSRDGSYGGIEEPELNPKWISLLIMEKACSPRLPTEGTFGTVRRSGGKFKERLREFGGLDAVFEVARKCHSIIEEWLEKSPSFAIDSKDNLGLESLALLLKCLRIMENATFRSKDNQHHLIRIRGNFDGQPAPRSFSKLVLSIIKILSGVPLLRNSSGSQSGRCINLELTSQGSLNGSQCSQSIMSSPELAQVSVVDPLLLKLRVESSTAGSCSGTSSNSEMNFGVQKRSLVCTNNVTMEDCQDFFAFYKDNGAALFQSGTSKKSLSQDSGVTLSGYKDRSDSVLLSNQQASNNLEYHHSQETSCSSTVEEDKSELLAVCLLTAVKVLINLTNDNPEGCQQIATCGGLEILSSLIAGHFPSFSSSCLGDVRETSSSSKSSPHVNQGINTALSDQELDFLVAILGLLVNLVEKDSRNRSRLAATSVSLPSLEFSGLEDQTSVISLLCSIFSANQGANEVAAGEENSFSLDEDSLIQGEKEAEKMIVEAYAALLLAFLSTESKGVRSAIAERLPKQNLAILVPVLERFVEFHLALNMISPETHSAVLEVIESCRVP